MEVKLRTDIKIEPEKVARMVKTKVGRALLRAAGYVRKVTRNSITPVPKASRGLSYSHQASSPGTPPHTRTGLLRKSVLFGLDNEGKSAYIGPAFHFISDIGALHERGGARVYPGKPRRYKLGSFGPIRDVPGEREVSRLPGARLTTGAMVERANELAESKTPANDRQRFPARPFVGPAFEKSKPYILKFFNNP